MGDAPVYKSIGEHGQDVHGRPALVRAEVRPAWDALVELVKQEADGVDLDTRILQAKGSAKASAGTHSDGAAIDVRVWNLTSSQRREIVRLARECGFPASWDRPWEGNEHLHLGADIPGVWTRISYQVDAVKDGKNGLGRGGRKGADDGPKPSAWRDTTTGPIWAAKQLGSTIERSLRAMSIKTEADLRKFVEDVLGPTPARAKWSHDALVKGGHIERRLARAEARVGPTTDARAQYAYKRVLELGPQLAELQKQVAGLARVVEQLDTTVNGEA